MYPSGIEFDEGLKRLVVADTGLNRIDIYTYTLGPTLDTSSFAKRTSFGSLGTGKGQFDSPRDVAIDGKSNIYVADAGNHRIQKFDARGRWRWTVGGLGMCYACLNTPIGVTWDTTNKVLLVA